MTFQKQLEPRDSVTHFWPTLPQMDTLPINEVQLSVIVDQREAHHPTVPNKDPQCTLNNDYSEDLWSQIPYLTAYLLGIACRDFRPFDAVLSPQRVNTFPAVVKAGPLAYCHGDMGGVTGADQSDINTAEPSHTDHRYRKASD